jgi:hypothetical protein
VLPCWTPYSAIGWPSTNSHPSECELLLGGDDPRPGLDLGLERLGGLGAPCVGGDCHRLAVEIPDEDLHDDLDVDGRLFLDLLVFEALAVVEQAAVHFSCIWPAPIPVAAAAFSLNDATVSSLWQLTDTRWPSGFFTNTWIGPGIVRVKWQSREELGQ